MLKFQLRRASLAAAALAVLTLPSAAQTDASFAAALGKLPPGLATMAQLKTQSQFPPAPQAQVLVAPADLWKEVLIKVMAGGEYSSIIGGVIIEDPFGNPNSNHTHQAVTFFGWVTSNQEFVFEEAVLDFDETRFDANDGNWHGSGWHFRVDIDGKILGYTYGESVTTPEGKVLSGGEIKVDRADPRIMPQYELMLRHWAER